MTVDDSFAKTPRKRTLHYDDGGVNDLHALPRRRIRGVAMT